MTIQAIKNLIELAERTKGMKHIPHEKRLAESDWLCVLAREILSEIPEKELNVLKEKSLLKVHVSLMDLNGSKMSQVATVDIDENNGFLFWFNGYGEHTSEDADAKPILVEYYNDQIGVHVWGDINKEDPTVTTNLDNAKVTLRKE